MFSVKYFDVCLFQLHDFQFNIYIYTVYTQRERERERETCARRLKIRSKPHFMSLVSIYLWF